MVLGSLAPSRFKLKRGLNKDLPRRLVGDPLRPVDRMPPIREEISQLRQQRPRIPYDFADKEVAQGIVKRGQNDRKHPISEERGNHENFRIYGSGMERNRRICL